MAAAAEYAAHSSARLFFGLAAVSDYPTVRELATLAGHAATLVAAYIQERPDADLELANFELDTILHDLLPLTDGRRGQHSHAELLGPVSAALSRSFPNALVVLHAAPRAHGGTQLRLRKLLNGLVDRLSGGDPLLERRLTRLAPASYLDHRDVIVLTYPAARAGDPGVLCHLLGQAIPALELAGDGQSSPPELAHLVIDAVGARRLGFSYLDELLAASPSPTAPFADRLAIVRRALGQLGYASASDGLLGRAWENTAFANDPAPAVPPAVMERVLVCAQEFEPDPYHAQDCAAEIAPLLDLLGNGIPPAQAIGVSADNQWPSARAILATSAVFNHAGLERLRRFVRLPGPAAADRLLLRQRKDELVTKALELHSFGAAFEGAPA